MEGVMSGARESKVFCLQLSNTVEKNTPMFILGLKLLKLSVHLKLTSFAIIATMGLVGG